MPNMTQSIEINQPVDVVETHYTNWEQYPEFIPYFRSVKKTGDEQIAVDLRVAGIAFDYTARVNKQQDHVYTWETTGGRISHRGTAKLQPAGADKTLLTLEVEYDVPGPDIVGKVSNWLGLADSGLRSSLENFRAFVEKGD